MVKIDVRKESDVTVLEVNGRVSMQTSHELLNALKKEVKESCRVLINLTGVDYMDSSGVGVLVTALKLSKEKSARLQLAGVNERVCAVMEMSGLSMLFEIHKDEASALAAPAP